MFTATRDAETKLAETVASIRDEASSWRGVHFRFDRLLDGYRNDYQVKIAVNLIHDLLKVHQGGIFVCQDASIYVVCRNVTKASLDKVIFQLRYLFMDDPLAYNAEGQENPEFCRIYDLSNEWERFNEVAKKVRSHAQKGADVPDIMPAPKPRAPKSLTEAKEPALDTRILGPKALAALDGDLHNADLTLVLRRQPVCAVVPGMAARRVFDETYINIAHLRKLLRTDADLLSDRWLFKYITRQLDSRVLDLLRRHPRYLESPLSLNFNVDTLLSEEFARFDAGLKPAAKVSVVIELHIADVFNDMQAFNLAKKTVQRRGYRICLDGMTPESFPHIDRESLGFDLMKLQWTPELDLSTLGNHNALLAAVNRSGANRVILCRCDGLPAVEFGQSLGISLFQGRHLDRIVNPLSKVEN